MMEINEVEQWNNDLGNQKINQKLIWEFTICSVHVAGIPLSHKQDYQ